MANSTHRLAAAAISLSAACAVAVAAAQPDSIIVAGGDSFVPGMFINADGEADGTDADLWRLWSKKTGVEVEFRLSPWQMTIPRLLAGEVDVVDGVSHTPDRAEILDFTEPYNVMAVLIYFHESVEGIRSLKDLNGFPVGVLAGSNTLEVIRAEGTGIKPIPYVAPQEMVTAAIDGRIRVFVSEAVIVDHYFAKLGGREFFRHAETPLTTSDLRMAVRKGDTATLELIERGMSLITRDERQDITEAWTGVGVHTTIPWRQIAMVAAVAFVVVALLVAWNAALQRRVAHVTRTLRESEQRNRLLIENSPVPILVHSEERIVFINPKGVRTLGAADQEELIGTGIWDIVHDDSRALARERIEAIYKNEEPASPTTEKFIRRDGTVIDVEVLATPITHDGHPGSQVVFTDITERLQAEENLRRERETVARVSETSPVGIAMVDADGRIVFANEAAEHVLGLSRDEVSGRAYNDPEWRITAPDGGPFPDEDLPFSAVKRSGAIVHDVRHAIEWPDGRRILLSVNASPLRDSSGEVTGMVATIEDVTERERAQEALLASEHNYRTIFNATSEAIFIHNATTGAIIDVNDPMCQMYGYAREEVVGSPIGDFSAGTSPYSQADAAALVRKAVEGEPQVFEWRARRKSGELFWVEVTLRRTDIGGEGRVLAVVRDITARKRSEAERAEFETRMRQTQKLESLGVLTGGIAHDFNNLLTVILGNADLVLEDMGGDSRVGRMLQEIKKTSLQASDLCQQMLAYAGRGKLIMSRLDLTATVRDMQQMFGVSVSKKAMLVYDLADDIPEVEADVSQIRQIIMNLVINASEALDDAMGQITIRTGKMQCDEAFLQAAEPLEDRPSGTYVFIEVIDTGAGMDPQTKERIFDPFFTTKFAGRGLGLAAVQGIVRGHKGLVEVETAPGEGSTLRVIFPAVEEEAGEARAVDGSQPDADAPALSGTVLVIDDEEPVRKVTHGMLDRLGLESLFAEDGAQGLKAFDEHSDDISLVLLDLNMPVMDGEECYRRIRAIRPDARVILCSGYDEQSIAPRFEGLGLAAFLKKPYQLRQFRDVVTRLLRE